MNATNIRVIGPCRPVELRRIGSAGTGRRIGRRARGAVAAKVIGIALTSGVTFAAFAASCCYSSRGHANTVTLKFESEVVSISGPWVGNDQVPEPPLTVQVGDSIRGTLEFDPALNLNGLDNSFQPFAMSFVGPSWILATDNYYGYVLDDRRSSLVVCDCAGSGPVSPDPLIFASDQFADPSLPAIDDRIELTRFVGLPPGVNDVVPGAPDWRWQPAISLVGSTGILHTDNHLPEDPATWNAFPLRELRFGLVGPAYAEVPGYGWQIVGYQPFTARATISSFVAVPEPSCLLLAVGLVAGWRRSICFACAVPEARVRQHDRHSASAH